MSTILQDVRLAARLLWKSPLFTVIVVATLSLAIGLNTAVFSAIDALLLRPLSGVQAPGRLVQLYRSWPGDVKYGSNSIPHYLDIKEKSGDVFSGTALWSFDAMNIATGGQPQRVFGMLVSANFFSVLGVHPYRGRLFLAQEDSGRLAHPVAVVSYAAWKRMFGGDSAVIGRKVVINGSQYQIVGVAPPDFHGVVPIVTPTFWIPLAQHDQIRPEDKGNWQQRDNNSYDLIARVKPGVTMAAVQVRMDALVRELRAIYPEDYKDSGITVVPEPSGGVHPSFRGAEVAMSAAVMAIVVLLLLIACVNVANLFLARARDRAREMAIRLSLGATRAALIRQLLIESLMFAGLSALVGLGIAKWAIALGNQIRLPLDVDFSAGLELSPTVLGFTLVASGLAALLFGIAPALQATRPSLVPALKGEEPAGRSRSRTRNGLVVAQMALSMILLVCAGLFLRNLKAATAVDKGFTSDHLLIAEVDPGVQGYSRARSEEFYQRVTQRLAANPSVAAVALGMTVPLSLSENDTRAAVPGYVPRANENMDVQYNVVSPGYFEAMGIGLISGRGFLARDDSAAQQVLVVNQQFASRYFAGHDPVGRIVHAHGRDHVVIGVVPTGKYSRLGEPPTPFMYFAQAQDWHAGMVIHIRTRGDPGRIVPALRAAVAAIDNTLPLSEVKPMNEELGIALLPARLSGAVLGIFGILGLIMAVIGMYGVMAYSVAQRTREIGIRMAIGAAASDVVRLIMRQGLALVLVGAGIGLAGAIAVSRLIAGVLYGGGANDPLTFVAIPVVLVAVATLATWLPARRAAATDPLTCLRRE